MMTSNKLDITKKVVHEVESPPPVAQKATAMRNYAERQLDREHDAEEYFCDHEPRVIGLATNVNRVIVGLPAQHQTVEHHQQETQSLKLATLDPLGDFRYGGTPPPLHFFSCVRHRVTGIPICEEVLQA